MATCSMVPKPCGSFRAKIAAGAAEIQKLIELAMMHTSHSWGRTSKPPTIRAHSQEKHKLLDVYLTRYVATLTQNIKIDHLALTVIDGFAGGNIYIDPTTGRESPGSPSIIINAIREAERVANEKRTKKFQIRDDYFFIEQDKEAFQSLELTLKLSEHARANWQQHSFIQ